MNAKLACVGMLGLMLACARSSGAQEPPPPPSFPSEANVITVDAVVLDEDGTPVRGLAQDDFEVYEEGRQEVVVFETRETVTAPPGSSVPRTVASSQPGDGGPGRVFALLIDDLGLTAPVASRLKPALADWIREKAHPRDEITIMTTSGDQWWTDTVERGRSDLLAVLERVKGKRHGGGGSAMFQMSDWEAYRIANHESAMEGNTPFAAGLSSRPENTIFKGDEIILLEPTVRDRVTQRWLNSQAECPPEPDLRHRLDRCRQAVAARAQEVHREWTIRASAVYGAIARLSRALAGLPGRKSILLVSEELLERGKAPEGGDAG